MAVKSDQMNLKLARPMKELAVRVARRSRQSVVGLFERLVAEEAARMGIASDRELADLAEVSGRSGR
jgi:hypothetical protein